MKVTYIKPLGYFDGRPIKPKVNQVGEVLELADVLEKAKNGNDKTKGASGSIYPISNGVLYSIDDVRDGKCKFETDGCIFIDIDKTENGDLTADEADIIFNAIKSCELQCCYAVAFSASHKIHLYLLIPQLIQLCEKYGKDIPDLYKRLANSCTEKVLGIVRNKTGISVIQDQSSNSIKQQHFLAVDDYFLQRMSFAISKDYMDQLVKEYKKSRKKKEQAPKEVSKEYELKMYEKPYSVGYISHTDRWQLFCSLSRLFSGDKLREEWEKCAELIPEENGHSKNYYKNVPYKLDWNRKLTGEEYCNIELLKQFGYVVSSSYHKDLNSTLNTMIEELKTLLGDGIESVVKK